ncbi:MAG: glucosaminidase domain-containing protein [Acidobacteriaceae bacterium]|nr:glucosaminidase domain-containing protein [Acidobacteriaceae bacterium]MBV9679848.1 glucosaminidase domain-containing protein [Acidobacteriaceae bacterium]
MSGASKQIMVALGLIALPITLRLEKVTASPKPKPFAKVPHYQPLPEPISDLRTIRLSRFLSKLHCPVSYLAEEFVHAADDNQIDWRLLPSISVIESGGGKAYRNNNIFGWSNGNYTFASLRAGINEVAFKLGKSSLYRNLDLRGKLRLYNPDQNYAEAVIAVMHRISPVVNLRPARRIVRQQNQYAYIAD